MFNLTEEELCRYINEDLPYLDLTTYVQEEKNIKATLEIYTREDIIVACSEEAASIAKILGCKIKKFEPSKTELKKGEVILKIKGSYEKIQQVLKLSQVLLEYSCKIATQTNNMLKIIKQYNSSCELLTTRKTIPFSKRMCIKAILCGGALPHRLGLSESILFFDYHRIIYDNNETFYKEINKLKNRLPEKKIVVESKTYEDSKKLIENCIDVLQLDKIDLDTTKKIIEYKNKINKNIKILLCGGINLSNVKDYAKLEIDGIVSSSMYSCGMANLGCKLKIKK
ncbi:ModD protein [Malaciobacter molluscorum]|uniref:ModD protein n=1 Tax=Malaciobacter molluscorum TaxID=1032072 RepID=UPI00100B5D0A|nr:ModD protein [Malaciobacter molluscorum]RXJ93554.1 ModD protein [Malaciobacter molluscorum]